MMEFPGRRDWKPRPSVALMAAPVKRPVPAKIAAIFNPACRHYPDVRDELLDQAEAAGLPFPSIRTTTRAEPGTRQAREALAEGADLVVVAGGDGTIRRVAAELAGSGVALGIIPTGSGDIMARNLGLRTVRWRAAVGHSLAGWCTPFDIGWVRCTVDGAELPAEAMLTMVGIGRDAQTVQELHPGLKRRLGWLAYAESGLRHALLPSLGMRLCVDGGPPQNLRAWTILVANCPTVPMGVTVVEGAHADDGMLDVLRVEVDGASRWGPIAAKGVFNHAKPVPGLRKQRARSVVIVPDQPLSVQIDGDALAGVTKLRVEIQPGALVVAVPAPKPQAKAEPPRPWRPQKTERVQRQDNSDER